MVLQRGTCHALAWLREIRIFADRPGRMCPLSDQSVRRQHLWDQTGDLSNGAFLAHRLPSGEPHLSFRVGLVAYLCHYDYSSELLFVQKPGGF